MSNVNKVAAGRRQPGSRMDRDEHAAQLGLSRRNFLKAGAAVGGGLVLSIILPHASDAAQLENKTMNPSSSAAFAPNAFIRIDRQGLISIIVHKAEMGQGTYTAIPMLIAEELDAELSQIRVEHAPADDVLYKEPLLGRQITGGSTSIRGAWLPMRTAGATARGMLVSAAAARWEVDIAECTTANGAVFHALSKQRLGYGDLADEAARLPVPSDVKLKDPRQFKLIGTPAPRLDSSIKLNGSAQFGIDVRLPGMRIATLATSPVLAGKLIGADDTKALAIKGVLEVIRIDDAIAVIADHMWAAKQGLAALEPVWSISPYAGFSNDSMLKEMEEVSLKSGVIARETGKAVEVVAAAKRKLEAVYQQPMLAHATMEPMNCTVHMRHDSCEIWVGTQVPTMAQDIAAKVTGLPKEKIVIHNQFLGGGFGRRLEVDFIEKAVRFALQLKGPVKFIWSREEDLQQAMYRPYYYDRLSAALDDNGMPLAWTHRVTGSSIHARFFPSIFKNGLDRGAVDGAAELIYDIPNVLVDYVRYEPPVPNANWRGVGQSHNNFVVEGFIDELAQLAGSNSLDYRRMLLQKLPRALAVLELAAEKAQWKAQQPAKQAAGTRRGQGIAVLRGFGSFLAQIADVEVSADGEVSVKRVVCAVDCGYVVNPDTVQAQIQGGILFGVSAALWGEVTFKDGKVQQSNFHDYRVLRINEVPAVDVYIVKSSEAPGGIGEPGTANLMGAVANAVFAATGTRVRRLPLSSYDFAHKPGPAAT